MTATVTKPTTMTEAMLVSSTAPENDYAVWAFGTFTVGQRRIMTTGVHHIYECLVGHTSTDATGAPNLNTTGTTPKWLDLGPTNTWKMFDSKVGTSTVLASPLTVVINTGPIGSLGLLELAGRQLAVTGKSATGGTVVYSKTLSLDGTIIQSFYDWFFEDYVQLTDVLLRDLPAQYTNFELTISVTSTSGSVGIGVCNFGKIYSLGNTLYGATVGIISYSTKTADTFGNITVVKRANSKRNNLKLTTEKMYFNRVFRLLASLDSIPCIYSAVDADGYEPMIVYGFWKDFSIEITYDKFYMTNLEIEGLI